MALPLSKLVRQASYSERKEKKKFSNKLPKSIRNLLAVLLSLLLLMCLGFFKEKLKYTSTTFLLAERHNRASFSLKKINYVRVAKKYMLS